ncbi:MULTISPECIES: bifunctional 2-polyprenyl-6-hydroxyphenol methylase/3-demethylubiquinol 3-O-methyltransferase UbiG [Brevibacterium]|uniref:class I SAM-dependent methyltransferase n=1 Tax=Brevibacterium TaxID=1696 RepID=UPI001BAD0944|nr:class I SAM-dependent methyltransferase [Brevibacterium sp. W7.2]
MEPFENRARAESFGSVAETYDRVRPRYPGALLTEVLGEFPADVRPTRVLDVGAGTGIFSAQLTASGCEVTAVEPDPEMAEVARSKGCQVEVSTFESWDAGDRTFDLVTFGQSFHWVDPATALPKIRQILRPEGRLALMWNRIEPVDGRAAEIAGVYEQFLPRAVPEPEPDDASHPDVARLEAHDFEVREITCDEPRWYAAHEWLSMVSTHSDQLTMSQESRCEMRRALAEAVGTADLQTRNRALLLLASPSPR